MDSALSLTTTAQILLFRTLHRHFSGAPPRSLLRRRNLKYAAVTSYNNHFRIPSSSTSFTSVPLSPAAVTSYNNHFRIPPSSTSFTSVPLSPSLRNFHALLSPTSCRTRCVSSSAASFGSSAGGGNGGAGVGNGGGGGGGGSGGESGDVRINLVGDVAQELSSLSPDVIILDVSGMVCGGCAASVKRILESQPQVSSASVNLTTETVIVWPVSEAKTAPNWQKQLGKTLAEHLTSCGFNSCLRASVASCDGYSRAVSVLNLPGMLKNLLMLNVKVAIV
ncbi:copper-transporting ATPase chloroplastic-like [Trifolium pratense]|uniref:Copper-transporting ATPase chloroplastic-like n=1 Tax=Trifolium pratense TaxID=57577 RepID=A0A2K3PRP8_TRIPR|nr:copper-transporting ATPase chloroplastic-like [Trifolium pratense]